MSQTEVLKQLSSMGRLVVCAGDSAVQSSTNLYELEIRLHYIPDEYYSYLLYFFSLLC